MLRRKRRFQILFYCRELENAYNIEMYEGMLEAANKRDYLRELILHSISAYRSERTGCF